MKFKRLALIGCGLMGGSFALGLRQAKLVEQIVGFSPSLTTRQRALQLQVIDAACDSVSQAVQGADLVLLAVPVSATAQSFAAMKTALEPNALLMDVGSTKCDVVAAAQSALGDRLDCLVPAHPIAGKEVAGVEHADATLYQQRRTILTPLPSSQSALVQRAQAVWQALGSHVSIMTPDAHDAAFAAVSHLPHLIAFAAVNALAQQDDALLPMAGPGFRDFSRIAASEPTVWRDILSANRHEVLAQLTQFKQALGAFESVLQQNNTTQLQQLIAQASQVRSAWTLQSGHPCDLHADN